MAITASTPDAFFDSEAWIWDFVVNQPDNSGPLDLTGSRLFVRFCAVRDDASVAECDSAANDGSLVIAPGATGAVTFIIAPEKRTWRIPPFSVYSAARTATVYGDLYRYAGGAAPPVGVCRIQFDVLAGSGLPT